MRNSWDRKWGKGMLTKCIICKKEFEVAVDWGMIEPESFCPNCRKDKSEEDQLNLIQTVSKLSQEAGFLRGLLDSLLLQLTYYESKHGSYCTIPKDVIDKIKEILNTLDKKE